MGVYIYEGQPLPSVTDSTGSGYSNYGGSNQGICITAKIDCNLDRVTTAGVAETLNIAQGTGWGVYDADTLVQYSLGGSSDYTLPTPYEMEANTNYVIWVTGGGPIGYSNISPLPLNGTNITTNYAISQYGNQSIARAITSVTTTPVGVRYVEKPLQNGFVGEWIDVTSLTLDKGSIRFSNAGETAQITATTVPAGATVTWSSSDTTVATVSSSGLVTCVTPGTCTITAESFGVTATCNVALNGTQIFDFATNGALDWTNNNIGYGDCSIVANQGRQITRSGSDAMQAGVWPPSSVYGGNLKSIKIWAAHGGNAAFGIADFNHSTTIEYGREGYDLIVDGTTIIQTGINGDMALEIIFGSSDITLKLSWSEYTWTYSSAGTANIYKTLWNNQNLGLMLGKRSSSATLYVRRVDITTE